MATSQLGARLLRFDSFELDVRAGELRKHGVRLRLQGQPLQVLAVLLKHAGDVVTREELRADIWTTDTFVDFDHSLHNAIARLREVLGDSAVTPRYIETLPRRGYRFIAPVDGGGHFAPSMLPTPRRPARPVSPPLTKYPNFLAAAFLVLFAYGSCHLGGAHECSFCKCRTSFKFHCRFAPREFVRRSVRGILRGWHDGPVDY